jgi:hypothetical protein
MMVGKHVDDPSDSSFFVWHITDVHVDPWYTVDSDARKCYCETVNSCPRMGPHCTITNDTASQAEPWGNSEGNCATPRILFQSAAEFMRRTQSTPAVYFTGDFAEAGASASCQFKTGETAQQQILDIIAWDWGYLKQQLPHAKVLGSLGNHDSAPGDVFYGGNENGDGKQSWEYNNLTALWGKELDGNPSGLQSLKRGGYYSTVVAPNLTVISLNINYWVEQNPQASANGSSAEAEGQYMMSWLQAELDKAETAGRAVHILGHQPPTGDKWIGDYWPQYTALCERFQRTIKGHFYGHIHSTPQHHATHIMHNFETLRDRMVARGLVSLIVVCVRAVDQWTLTRACQKPTKVPEPPTGYVETMGGIKWCSGGGNYKPSAKVFNTSLDGNCPLTPANWSADYAAVQAQAVCDKVQSCVGFTLYMESTSSTKPREVCFRTGTCSSKPAAPGSTTRW